MPNSVTTYDSLRIEALRLAVSYQQHQMTYLRPTAFDVVWAAEVFYRFLTGSGDGLAELRHRAGVPD